MGILIPSFRDFSYHIPAERRDFFPKSQDRELDVIAELIELQELKTSDWPQLEKYAFMSEYIPGIMFHTTGGVCPFQAEGVWENYEFYYRERGGVAELRLAPIGTFPSHSKAHWEASINVEEFREGNGWISTFLTLWKNLQETETVWGFPAYGWTRTKEDKRVRSNTKNMTVDSRAKTREEAFTNLYIRSYEDYDTYGVVLEEGYILNDGSRRSNVSNPSESMTVPKELIKISETIVISDSVIQDNIS